MATSRRRERELARRRFERRRQAQAEHRARQRRRATLIGSIAGTVVVIVALVLIGIKVFGHSSKQPLAAGATSTVSPAARPSPTPSATSTAAPAAPSKCARISPNPPATGEPRVPDVTGKPSTRLVAKDVVTGKGAVAKSGKSLTVQYVGISCSTGKPFDASYTDGAKNQEFTFTLGKGAVIPGWDKGLVGEKVGGERELVIPASLGYGAAGTNGIKGNETLIFLVHLVKVAA